MRHLAILECITIKISNHPVLRAFCVCVGGLLTCEVPKQEPHSRRSGVRLKVKRLGCPQSDAYGFTVASALGFLQPKLYLRAPTIQLYVDMTT